MSLKQIKGSTHLLRFCALVVTGFMLFSFFLPWWSVTIYTPSYEGLPNRPSTVQIYGHGLRHNMDELRQYIAADETPKSLQTLAWVYIGAVIVISLGVLLISKFNRFSWLAGLMGLSYLVYALTAVFVIVKNRAHEFGIELTGLSSSSSYGGAEVSIGFDASIQQGFFFAIIAGAVLFLLSLIYMVICTKNPTCD